LATTEKFGGLVLVALGVVVVTAGANESGRLALALVCFVTGVSAVVLGLGRDRSRRCG
jgi:hypothetical protein